MDCGLFSFPQTNGLPWDETKENAAAKSTLPVSILREDGHASTQKLIFWRATVHFLRRDAAMEKFARFCFVATESFFVVTRARKILTPPGSSWADLPAVGGAR